VLTDYQPDEAIVTALTPSDSLQHEHPLKMPFSGLLVMLTEGSELALHTSKPVR